MSDLRNKVLEIIDKERTRYKVSLAVEKFVAAEVKKARISECELFAAGPGYEIDGEDYISVEKILERKRELEKSDG